MESAKANRQGDKDYVVWAKGVKHVKVHATVVACELVWLLFGKWGNSSTGWKET